MARIGLARLARLFVEGSLERIDPLGQKDDGGLSPPPGGAPALRVVFDRIRRLRIPMRPVLKPLEELLVPRAIR